MSDMSKIVPMVLLIGIFVIGIPYTIAIMGSVDAGVDLEGSDYQAQYDASTDTSIATLGIIGVVPYILGAGMLLIAAGAIRKSLKGRY